MKIYIWIFLLCSINVVAQNAHLDSLEKLAQNKTLPDSTLVLVLNQIAFEHRSISPKSIIEKAQYAQRCIDSLFTKKKLDLVFYEKALADAVFYQAIGYRNLGNYKKSLELVQLSIKIIDGYGDTRRKGFNYQFKGDLHRRIREYDKAKENVKKGYEIFDRLQNTEGKAYCYGILAKIYQDEGNFEQAKHYYEASIEFYKTIKTKSDLLAELSFLYLSEKKYEEAYKLLSEALLLATTTQKNKLIEGQCLLGLIKVYNGTNKYNKAINLGERLVYIVDSLESVDMKIECFKELIKSYENQGQQDKALHFAKRLLAYKDSVLDQQRNQEIANLEALYEIEKQQERIANLEKEQLLNQKEQQKQQFYFIGLGLTLLGLALALLLTLRIIRLRQRNAKVLFEKNLLIKQANDELAQNYEELLEHDQVLKQKNELIEQKNLDILDSINYALRIQTGILPSQERMREFLDFFIFYQPKDIVSGDFYWFAQTGQQVAFAVVDCTGHGVPGAFMTLIANNLLNQIFHIFEVREANKILENLSFLLARTLKSDNFSIDDGMDIGICTLEYAGQAIQKLYFSGSMIPLYLVQNQEITEIKADKKNISASQKEPQNFTLHSIEVDKPTTIYLATDGYQDQFGGKQGKKFMKGNFRKLLSQIHTEDLETQASILKTTIDNWINEATEQQVDDITVTGIRINF